MCGSVGCFACILLCTVLHCAPGYWKDWYHTMYFEHCYARYTCVQARPGSLRIHASPALVQQPLDHIKPHVTCCHSCDHDHAAAAPAANRPVSHPVIPPPSGPQLVMHAIRDRASAAPRLVHVPFGVLQTVSHKQMQRQGMHTRWTRQA